MKNVSPSLKIIHRATSDSIDLFDKILGPMKFALGISDKEISGFIEKVINNFLPDVIRYATSDPAKHKTVEYAYDTTCSKAIMYYRIAHATLDWELLGDIRIRRGIAFKIYEEAKLQTGIDIHPGALIGPGLVIDHGVNTKIEGSFQSGTVIGETTIIGKNVTILNGVLLGARDVNDGTTYTTRRHPKIGNNVTICGNVQILGGIEIGDNSFIGPGCIITQNIPPDTYCKVQTTVQMTHTKDNKGPELYAVVTEGDHLAVHGNSLDNCSLSFVDEKHQNCRAYVANIVEKNKDKIVFDIQIQVDSNDSKNTVRYLCVTSDNKKAMIASSVLKHYLANFY